MKKIFSFASILRSILFIFLLGGIILVIVGICVCTPFYGIVFGNNTYSCLCDDSEIRYYVAIIFITSGIGFSTIAFSSFQFFANANKNNREIINETANTFSHFNRINSSEECFFVHNVILDLSQELNYEKMIELFMNKEDTFEDEYLKAFKKAIKTHNVCKVIIDSVKKNMVGKLSQLKFKSENDYLEYFLAEARKMFKEYESISYKYFNKIISQPSFEKEMLPDITFYFINGYFSLIYSSIEIETRYIRLAIIKSLL